MRIIVKQVSDYFQPMSESEAEKITHRMTQAIMKVIEEDCLDVEMGAALMSYSLGEIAADCQISISEIKQLVEASYNINRTA